ncbi:MAG: hypothetical protein PHD76_03750 [Methylacidiphilales bacterium]|nr:hypothetical protein [Candidatus Methylacidiphilales bacterium]
MHRNLSQIVLFGCVVLCLDLAQAEDQRFEQIVQSKSDDTALVGNHSILKSDTVNLEFRVNPLNANWNKTTATNTVNNNLGVVYNYQLTRQAGISQEYSVGIKAQQQDLSDPSYLADYGSMLDQRYITRLKMTPSQKLNWSIFNELGTQMRNDRTSANDVWRYGTNLDWQFMPQTTLHPEISMENHSEGMGQFWSRREYGVTLRRDLFQNKLSLNFRPSDQMDEQYWLGGRNSDDFKMESSLVWKVADKNSLSFGNRKEDIEALNQNYGESVSTYFAEWAQNPYPEINMRLRAEYESREINDGATNPLRDTVRFVASPRWNFNDGLSAGAEFRYSHGTGSDYTQSKEDEALLLSLSRSF